MAQTTRAEDATATRSPRVLAAVASRTRAPSLFGVIPKESVRRRPGDILHVLVGILLIAAGAAVTDGFTARADEGYRWLSELPSWIGTTSTLLFLACTIGATAVVVLALVLTRNFRLALTLVVVGSFTAAVAAALAVAIDLDEIRQAAGTEAGTLSGDAVVWLATATAILLTAAPYLVRPARRCLHTTELLAIVGAVFAAVAPLGLVLAAVGLGWIAATATGLVLGTPSATPTLRAVAGALDDLGILVDRLALDELQTWGETRFVGRAADGSPASVVVLGRDATDVRLITKVWRSIVYRDAGPSVAITRSAQLEHRAYMLLMAAKAGVVVSDVVIAAGGGRDDLWMLVLLDPIGRPLSEREPDDLSETTLDDLWANVGRLHDARLIHGQLSPESVMVGDDGRTALRDFSRGSAGATQEQRVRDRVDLLAVTAALVGDERALAAAVRAIGADGLENLLPMMETAALSPAARRAVPDAKKRLQVLREAAAGLIGCDIPKLAELRRVSASSILMALLTLVGFYLIVAQFAGVDLASTLDDAELAWVLVACLISFVPQFAGSVALRGSVGAPLPFGPVLAEQFANNFTGLIGGTVATTALVMRFFQKQGLKAAVAASSAVLNSLAGAIVQIVLVATGLFFSNTQFVPSDTGGGSGGQLILIAIVVVGVGVTGALLVPKLRHAVHRRVAPEVGAAKENLQTILGDPRKALMIFGGNACSQLAFALVINAALLAYGGSLPLLDIIVINSLASLLGGLAPVPGGMGVNEAGLIAGMTAAGVPDTVAVAATFTARLFTTYLSPIWGWFALRWLRRSDYV